MRSNSLSRFIVEAKALGDVQRRPLLGGSVSVTEGVFGTSHPV